MENLPEDEQYIDPEADARQKLAELEKHGRCGCHWCHRWKLNFIRPNDVPKSKAKPVMFIVQELYTKDG